MALKATIFKAEIQIADMDRWQPRFGFAWDIAGNSKYVLRGSAGRFRSSRPPLPPRVKWTSRYLPDRRGLPTGVKAPA